jgi:phospholipid N-methyltransferase
MPRLDDPMHLRMHRDYQLSLKASLFRNFFSRVFSISGNAISEVPEIYGYEWGNPETCPPLTYIRDHFVCPYISRSQIALEVGPGGGRWTKYLLGFKELYVVDYHSELLQELRRNYDTPNMVFIKNNGTDFPGVNDKTIDYLFSFGVFVHLDTEIIDGYLSHIGRVIKPGANVVIQYSDKTKILAQTNVGFSDNTPERMRQMVLEKGYEILEEDLTTLWHSSVVRFTMR